GRLPRFPADREPLLLDIVDQQVERPVDDAGQVSIRNTVPEQVLCSSQLVVKFLACGELHPVGLFGKRRDGGPMVFALRRPCGRWIEGVSKRLRRGWSGPLWKLRIVGATAG